MWISPLEFQLLTQRTDNYTDWLVFYRKWEWTDCKTRKMWEWWILGRTYRRVFGAAGKRYATFLTTRVRISAVEVDIQIPVISSESSATLPLQGEIVTKDLAYVNNNPYKWLTRGKNSSGVSTVDLTNTCSHIPAWSLWGSADQCRLCRPECCC